MPSNIDNKRLMRFMLMALLSVLVFQALNGCGWRLRGSLGIALDLPPMMLDAREASSALKADLERGLTNSGVTLVSRRDEAELILLIENERRERRVLTVNSVGKVNEYELQYSLEYTVLNRQGDVVRPLALIEQQRDYVFDEDDVLATGEEQAKLFDDMRIGLVQRLLLSLRSLVPAAQTVDEGDATIEAGEVLDAGEAITPQTEPELNRAD